MDGVLTLNNNYSLTMPNTKNTKKDVIQRIKNKLEQAKLDLIYTELQNANIPFEKKYSKVDELIKDLKGNLNELDYNKANEIIQNINNNLDTTVNELEKGSTNAFTKLMTSDLAKTIAKTLGISLAGRTALLLAPTVTAKLAIGAGLSAYGLYRLIKNRKETIKANETNELNNILMDLEVMKDNSNNYIDTRFDLKSQDVIREFLKKNNIPFKDTGYRSLRQVIYSLNNKDKKKLCILLNNNLAKDIDIESRIKKAKRSLNVVATAASTIGTGTLFGTQVANAINSIDPAILAGPLNGTVLGKWMESVSDKKWLSTLTSGLGLAGTEVLENIPVIGGVATKVFAAENLATLATVGAVGGLAVGAGLGIVSALKRVHANIESKKELKKFLELDASKYNESDKEELIKISESVHEPDNLIESTIIDIVIGYLKENDIILTLNPRSLEDLNLSIDKLPPEEKKKAKDLLNTIYASLKDDNNFAKDLKKAGKMSIGLFIAGAAALSVYDIIKGGTYLPELSQKLFPENNIYSPVSIPTLDEKLNVFVNSNNQNDIDTFNKGTEIYNEFINNDKYMIECSGYEISDYGVNYAEQNPGLLGRIIQTAYTNAGMTKNLADNIAGNTVTTELIPDPVAISNKLNTLSPNELYGFYRYFNTLSSDDSMMYKAIKAVLGYDKLLEKATSVVTNANNTQKMHELVNDISNKLSTGAIPFATAMEILGLAKKNNIILDSKKLETNTMNK